MTDLSRLQAQLGYAFREPELLLRALTHASVKSPDAPCNERLEFLGDAVLGMVIAHFLFNTFPGEPEGELTRLRSRIVSAPALARLGRELGLDHELTIGKGLARQGLSSAVLADGVEAVIGAVYLDGGLEAAQSIVLWGLAEVIEEAVEGGAIRNYKSLLQERTQQEWKITPTYDVVAESGPDHKKRFVVVAKIEGVERGRGEGLSKKLAEQAAAKQALSGLLRA